MRSIIPTSLIGKLNHKESKFYAQDHRDTNKLRVDSNSMAPESLRSKVLKEGPKVISRKRTSIGLVMWLSSTAYAWHM